MLLVHLNKPHLVAPLVDYRHVDVVYEDSHPAAGRRPIGGAHTFVDVALNGPLEHAGQRGRREVQRLTEVELRVQLISVALQGETCSISISVSELRMRSKSISL